MKPTITVRLGDEVEWDSEDEREKARSRCDGPTIDREQTQNESDRQDFDAWRRS